LRGAVIKVSSADGLHKIGGNPQLKCGPVQRVAVCRVVTQADTVSIKSNSADSLKVLEAALSTFVASQCLRVLITGYVHDLLAGRTLQHSVNASIRFDLGNGPRSWKRYLRPLGP